MSKEMLEKERKRERILRNKIIEQPLLARERLLYKTKITAAQIRVVSYQRMFCLKKIKMITTTGWWLKGETNPTVSNNYTLKTITMSCVNNEKYVE